MTNLDFDYNSLFEDLPVVKKHIKTENVILSASSEAVIREKLEKRLFGKKKDYYPCRYERALITIAEKDNGEY